MVQLTFSSFLSYQGKSIILQTAVSLPETQEPNQQAGGVGKMAGSEEKPKTWLLPSRNLLSSWKNKECTHQSPSILSTRLVEGTENISQRANSIGDGRKVSQS